MQFEDPGEETMLDEDCTMEVDSQTDSRKKLDQRKGEITDQLRQIEEIMMRIAKMEVAKQTVARQWRCGKRDHESAEQH